MPKAKTRVHPVHLLRPILGLFVRDGEVKYFVSGAEGKGQKYWKTKMFRQLKDKEKLWTGWTGKALYFNIGLFFLQEVVAVLKSEFSPES